MIYLCTIICQRFIKFYKHTTSIFQFSLISAFPALALDVQLSTWHESFILVWYRSRMQLAHRNGFCLASERIYCSIFCGGIHVLSYVP